MAIDKLTVPPTNVEVIEKINEIIDAKQDAVEAYTASEVQTLWSSI